MWRQYHKIQTVFERDVTNNYKTVLVGQFSLPIFEFLKDTCWVWTEKVDGTNIRVRYFENQITIGGKTDNAQIPAKLFENVQRLFDPGKLQQAFDQSLDVTFYGEGYGPKIQKGGGNYGTEQTFVLFDVTINGSWLDRDNVEDVASKVGLDVVPIVGRGPLHEMTRFVEAGFNSRWGAFLAEGVVARPEVELCDRRGQRVITKLKMKDFNR